jgi:hypothetical protein
VPAAAMGQTAPKLIPFPLTHFWGISVSIFQFAQGKEKREKGLGLLLSIDFVSGSGD